MDTFTTLTLFRKYDDGQIIALFPKEVADQQGNCLSYAHIGQHSAATFEGVCMETEQATPEEYTDLQTELEGIGYNLDIRDKPIINPNL